MKHIGRMHDKRLAAMLAAAVLILAIIPITAFAAVGQPQVVRSSWTDIINVDDGYPYNWRLFSEVTVTDGIVTDVLVTGKANSGGDVPAGHKPYYTLQKVEMEERIIEARIPASNPDAVDAVDTVSGATQTTTSIKVSVKEALVKWNENAEKAKGAIDAINAIPSSSDKIVAAANARAAFDALKDDLQSYVSVEVYKILTDAEAEILETDLSNGAVSIVGSSFVYTGKALAPGVVVKTKGGKTLTKDTDYTVTYTNNKNVGNAGVTVTGKGSCRGSNTATFTIKPASQTIKAAKTYKVKFSKVKKARQTVAVKFTASGSGKITYAKAKSGKVSIAKNGKVTVAKGAKKGTYTLKVKVTAAAKGNYAKTTSTVALKVKVA